MKQHVFLKLLQRCSIDFWFWIRSCNTGCQKSHPGIENELPKCLLPAWNLILSQRQVFLETNNQREFQKIATIRERNTWCRRRSTPKYMHTTQKNKRVQLFWARRHWVTLRTSWLEQGYSLSARHGHPLFPFNFNGFEMGSMVENPTLIDEEEGKEDYSPPTTPVSETPKRRTDLLRSRHLEQGLKIFVIILTKIASKGITLRVFSYSL